MISKFAQILYLALLSLPALAQQQQSSQSRINYLEHAVLAPCCYTESVAIHQSEAAVKMRLEIAKWVAEGKSDQSILDTYAGLYGSKVLVDPRTMPRGWTPFLPWFVLILGAFLVMWLLKRWRSTPRTATALSAAEIGNLPDFDED